MSSDADEPVAHARLQLRDARTALAQVTGGAAPRQVLAELAQELASDLAAHFDELPMHRYSGFVSRAPSLLRFVLPPRVVPHRVVMGRYLSATAPQNASGGFTRQHARIALLGLGADGVLRSGIFSGQVMLPVDSPATTEPLASNDIRIARAPNHAIFVRRWDGGPDPRQVAGPRPVFEALTAIATALAAESNKDLALLQRVLQKPVIPSKKSLSS